MCKKTLLMLPGWGADESVFEGVMEHLKGKYDFVDVTWSGIGSPGDVKKAVTQAVRSHDFDDISILAWSMGAIAAIEALPDLECRVEKLILISPTSSFCCRTDEGYDFGWKPLFLERLIKKVKSDKTKALEAFYNSMFSSEEMHYADKLRDVYLRFACALSSDSLVAGLEYLRDSDVRLLLGSIAVPTLIVQGSDDSVCDVEGVEYVYDAINAHKTMKTIIGAGHMPFVTSKDECLRAIGEFLEIY